MAEPEASIKYDINFRDPLPEVTGGHKSQQKWDTRSSGRISWGQGGLDITGSSALSAAEEFASLGVLGQIFVRTAFEAARSHTVKVATEEIARVVLTPLPESPQSANSGLVHLFAQKRDGSREVHCLCFAEPRETRTSQPPLWLLWGWLTENIPADKLEVIGGEYDKIKQLGGIVTKQAAPLGRPDLRLSPKATLEEQLDMLLNELLPPKPLQSWYRQPQIPAKKLKNAIAQYAPEIGADEVLFLGDTSVFGSGKNGWMLTKRGIHYNAGEKGSATWKEIQKAVPVGGFPEYRLELTIKRGDKVETAKIECTGFQEARPGLLELINQMAAFNQGAVEDKG